MRLILLATLAVVPGPSALSAQAIDSARLASIRSFIEAQAARDSFSGVVLIAHNGRTVLQHASGLANKAHAVPNRVDTKFYLASMTKMFTGIAIAQLAEQGRLRFPDPVSRFVPEAAQSIGGRITIHHLLTHTSGLGSIWKPEYQRANHALFRRVRDFFPLFIDDPPQFEPGERWAYSNAGYVLLGAVIEQVTGQQYRDYVREHVFRRAGMTSALEDDVEVPVSNRAVPYTRNNWTMPGHAGYTSAESIGLATMMPAGGAVANAPDLLSFANALAANRLLRVAYTDTVTRGKVTYRPGASYGYGFANEVVNGVRIIFHDGGADGISTNLDIIPALGITAIVLSNYDPPAGRRIANHIRQVLTAQPMRNGNDRNISPQSHLRSQGDAG
ncbi:MAG: serine hydrolase domain-containing protein [Gemmatimonadota bacterium]